MPDLNEIVKTALTDRLAKYQKASFDTSQLATALGANQGSSGVFGTVKPEQLLGLLPEDVEDIAKTRSATAYQDMLTNIGALDFVNKMTGKEEIEKSTSDIIQEEQRAKNALALAKEQGQSGKWQHDPMQIIRAEVFRKATAGKKLTKPEWSILNKTVGGMDAADASQLVQTIPLMLKAYGDDPESRANAISLLKSATKVIEETSLESGNEPTLPKGTGGKLDKATAQKFLDAAGGDANKARELATKNGWKL